MEPLRMSHERVELVTELILLGGRKVPAEDAL